MASNTRELTTLQGVLSLLAALMCGWLGMVFTACLLVLVRVDVLLLCCQGIFLLPTVGFLCCRYGWRHTAAGRGPGATQPAPFRARLWAVALVAMTAVSPKLPAWLSESVSSKPSKTQLSQILSTKGSQMERIARIVLQHPGFEFAYREPSGKIEVFPHMPEAPAHENAIYTFLKEASAVDYVSVEPQSRVVRFETWESDGEWFSHRVRGVAFAYSPPEGTVTSIENPSERQARTDTHFENIHGPWYVYETCYDP